MRDVILERLAEVVREEGGLLAGALRPDAQPPHGDDPDFGGLAVAGPRADGREQELALVVEAIREGYLLHYGEPRILDPADRDLALLAGDRLYALGLARLAELGDLHAVGELADVIALSAQAHAEDREELADAVWEAGVTAVGWGETEALRAAKQEARAGAPDAARALRAAASQARGDVAPVR